MTLFISPTSLFAREMRTGDTSVFGDYKMNDCPNLFGIAAFLCPKMAKFWFRRFPCRWENMSIEREGYNYTVGDFCDPNDTVEFTLEAVDNDTLIQNNQEVRGYIYAQIIPCLDSCLSIRGLVQEVLSFIEPVPIYIEYTYFRKSESRTDHRKRKGLLL